MKKTRLTKVLSLIICMVLTAAITLITIGCSDDSAKNKETQSTSANADVSTSHGTGEQDSDSNVLGTGQTSFDFTVTDAEGKETAFTIKTDKKMVGEALLDVGLIAGEAGQYGLYVKTVNGITVDYDKDGKYWAFYVDGEYAMSGVDTTEIKNGASYAFKVE